jgi:hypothetical protein
MHCAVELRKSKRYQLSAPALFMWAHQDRKPLSGRGVTRDINTHGVYVLTDALLPVGARVHVEIVLPKLVNTGSGMHLHGEGVVLRTDPHSAKSLGATETGFAASVQFYHESADSVLSSLKTSGQVV